VTDEEHPVNRSPLEDTPRQHDHDDRDPADRAPSWGPEALPPEDAQPPAAAQTPEATQEEWDRLLDEADAPPPADQDPRDHPDVPDSARRMLRDDTSAG
jgi:hypothetical protein